MNGAWTVNMFWLDRRTWRWIRPRLNWKLYNVCCPTIFDRILISWILQIQTLWAALQRIVRLSGLLWAHYSLWLLPLWLFTMANVSITIVRFRQIPTFTMWSPDTDHNPVTKKLTEKSTMGMLGLMCWENLKFLIDFLGYPKLFLSYMWSDRNWLHDSGALNTFLLEDCSSLSFINNITWAILFGLHRYIFIIYITNTYIKKPKTHFIFIISNS